VVGGTLQFHQEAREESVRTWSSWPKRGRTDHRRLPRQQFQEELLESLPEGKAIVGTGDYSTSVEVRTGWRLASGSTG